MDAVERDSHIYNKFLKMALDSPMTSLIYDGYNNDESVDFVQLTIKFINNSMSAALDLFRDVLLQTSRVLFNSFSKMSQILYR